MLPELALMFAITCKYQLEQQFSFVREDKAFKPGVMP
jgi:hypothetical protein